eukprot:CAMPEP_0182458448 /NCGR_PEP_ID=MMETSP1319-20130603/3791_1 /TAXON_ID=172717 /ORGANISM="Bolidomonas pacifica, Strain RCC208" /LENGTH=179 /DNA_ID=CAMNT_0024657137 /DNA_START=73 /DNA_END=612 /DNA_ORIENTATION=-
MPPPLRPFVFLTLGTYSILFYLLSTSLSPFKTSMLDTTLLWSTQAAKDLLGRLEFRGLLGEATKFYAVDLFFGCFYAPALSSFYHRLLIPPSSSSSSSARTFITLTPYIAFLFDFFENLSILYLLHTYPSTMPMADRRACVFGGLMTLCKWNSFVVLPGFVYVTQVWGDGEGLEEEKKK